MSNTTPKVKRNLKALENLKLENQPASMTDEGEFRKPADIPFAEQTETKQVNQPEPSKVVQDNIPAPKATPAFKKAKQFKNFFQSPTDSLMSPFTRNFGAGKSHFQHPALLKPKRLDDESAQPKK